MAPNATILVLYYPIQVKNGVTNILYLVCLQENLHMINKSHGFIYMIAMLIILNSCVVIYYSDAESIKKFTFLVS